MRLDAYVAEYWPEHSRSTWQKYIKAGHVQVNGDVVLAVNYELNEDDAVTVAPPQKPIYAAQNLPILYEDEHVTVINKPVGILTHAKGALLHEFTVAEFMRTHFTGTVLTSHAENAREGIVHRLDRDTSGVLICARNPTAMHFLQKQFSLKKAKKTYLAIIEGTPKIPEAILKLPIERNPKAPATFRVGINGKLAETAYKVLWTNEKLSLVELKPVTGRTHQLRVHMQYIGTPIINDRFYQTAQPKGRLGLHAWQLEITVPGGQRKTFTALVPEDFKQLLPQEAQAWIPR